MSARVAAPGVLQRLHLLRPLFVTRERLRALRAGPLPATRADGLPLPPAGLQVRVMGWASPEFEALGAADAANVRDLCTRTGASLDSLTAVLDFGAGCGCISRHWAGVDGPRFHACDRRGHGRVVPRANLPSSR